MCCAKKKMQLRDNKVYFSWVTGARWCSGWLHGDTWPWAARETRRPSRHHPRLQYTWLLSFELAPDWQTTATPGPTRLDLADSSLFWAWSRHGKKKKCFSDFYRLLSCFSQCLDTSVDNCCEVLLLKHCRSSHCVVEVKIISFYFSGDILSRPIQDRILWVPKVVIFSAGNQREKQTVQRR